MTSPFTPRHAIITGSDSGIGAATALALAERGVDVGITWHSDEDGANSVAEKARTLGVEAVTAKFDATDLENVEDVVSSMARQLGGLDVFINNAGGGGGTPFLKTSIEEWRSTVALNLDGAFVAMQAAARIMRAAGNGGRIIAVTSVHETQPRVGSAAYVSAKHGLGGLVKTMAQELGADGITVNAIAPGEIATPINDMESEDADDTVRPGIPLRRPGKPEEIASVIAFLASSESSYVTGASWTVDGGMLQMGPQAGSHLTTDAWREG